MRILLTNDDGIHAEGLAALRVALRDLGDTMVVAPDREQSGVSHALTMNRPLRIRDLGDGVFTVDGTPTDCVLLAVRGLPSKRHGRPDLVVSGINHGSNLGDDVTYSGTVAAAMEGSLFGIPSLALSLDLQGVAGFAAAAALARRLIARILERPLPKGLLLNVNFPDRPAEEIAGVRITRLSSRIYPSDIEERKDPLGRPYYWIADRSAVWTGGEESDYGAVQAGFVSITPLDLDLTDPVRSREISDWNLDLDPR